MADKFFVLSLLKMISACSGVAVAMYTLDDFFNIDQGVGITVAAVVAYVGIGCAQKYMLRPKCKECHSRIDKPIKYSKPKKS